MDKTERFVRDELSNDDEGAQLDIDAMIDGTHFRIKKRSTRRRVLYSSPIAIFLVMVGGLLLTGNDEQSMLPGDELFMTGWEYSWIDTEDLDVVDSDVGVFYEQTVDYLIDDIYFTYSDGTEGLLDESEFETLKGYLEEV